MIEIRELKSQEITNNDNQLAALLRDVVEGGASVGFLPPLTTEDARGYWSGVATAIDSGDRVVIAAFEDGALIGSVQLGLENRANGSHRGEVMKLIVRRSARGKGLGKALMSHVEATAKSLGRKLLVLDTRSGCGDVAEAMYYRLGYRKAGVIPKYAQSACGTLHDTVFMYRELE